MVVNSSGYVDGISIHAPREGSDFKAADTTQPDSVSIHAPREGSDTVRNKEIVCVKISIHAPREGSDYTEYPVVKVLKDFNPRSP